MCNERERSFNRSTFFSRLYLPFRSLNKIVIEHRERFLKSHRQRGHAKKATGNTRPFLKSHRQQRQQRGHYQKRSDVRTQTGRDSVVQQHPRMLLFHRRIAEECKKIPH